MIDQIIDYKKTFVEQKGYEKYITDKYPDKKLAVLSCMDTRLTELLPAALGFLLLCSCHNGKTSQASDFDSQTEIQDSQSANPSESKITAEMAYEGVNNYCHREYDWSVAEENPDIMYLTMGEETDSAYQVVFRSYTGAFVHFYVNKTSGTTKIVERVPNLDVEEDDGEHQSSAGTIDLFDYLEKKN